MKTTALDFTTTIVVDKTAMDVFAAVSNPRAWWSEEIEGGTENLNDVFEYHYQDVHFTKMKLTEVIPGKKMVWTVLENRFSFTKDKKEWVDTNLVFDISEKNGKTELKFTHVGLVPSYECYDVCNDGWNNYINISLRNLIVTGKGAPNTREGGFNDELSEKHSISVN